MTDDTEIKTASWKAYQQLEAEFRSAASVLSGKHSVQAEAALAIALAIRTGLTEVALEIKSHRFNGGSRNGGRA